ncbi:MAG: exodeoxyribonuclease VII large subunit [Planctomycetes bacterium]|nr:exodeoxyribonuclease VII large subunit [Planctomycetota bacterium]
MAILFDPNRAKGPTDDADVTGGRDVTGQFVGARAAEPLTVSALVAEVRRVVSEGMPRRVAVVGQISNLSQPASGHVYFSLKDASAQIPAAMFRQAASKVKFALENGMEVVAEGRMDVYEAQGKLQLYVDRLAPRGAGALELAFRQLVARLEAEGLFDPARKRPIPRYPRVIGVVTSPTGAAIRDIRRTLGRRWPSATVYLIGVPVQGDAATPQIARAIRAASANAARLGIDTLIVGRGGGSLEDLWCFNEEAVARAIAACGVPVISGVGHETDTTIADMVADLRAATPTAAAVLATPDGQALRAGLLEQRSRLDRMIRTLAAQGRTALRLVQRSEFFRNPLHRVQAFSQRVDDAGAAMRSALLGRAAAAARTLAELTGALRWNLGGQAKRRGDQLARAAARLAGAHPRHRVRLTRQSLSTLQRQLELLTRGALRAAVVELKRYERTLEALSYRNVLARGFSVTRDAKGQILRDAAAVHGGQRIRTELAAGEIRSVVEGPPPPRTPKSPPPDQPTLFGDV